MKVSELYKKADDSSPGPRELGIVLAISIAVGLVATAIRWLLG